VRRKARICWVDGAEEAIRTGHQTVYAALEQDSVVQAGIFDTAANRAGWGSRKQRLAIRTQWAYRGRFGHRRAAGTRDSGRRASAWAEGLADRARSANFTKVRLSSRTCPPGCPQMGSLLLTRQLRSNPTQLEWRSGLFRRVGLTRAAGRLGGRSYLVQPADRAQHVRPCVPTLLVLPREVRRASNKHDVEASAKGKPRNSRYPAEHRGSPAHRYGGRSGAIALQPAIPV
jgi:hypothetical protein